MSENGSLSANSSNIARAEHEQSKLSNPDTSVEITARQTRLVQEMQTRGNKSGMQATTEPSQVPKVTELLKVASTCAGLLGGFILLSYFFSIEYFPIFDFKAAASLLFSLAFVCSILLMAFTLLLVVPQAMVAQYLLRRGAPPSQRKRLDRELGLMSLFCWVTQVIGIAAVLVLDKAGLSIEGSLAVYGLICFVLYTFSWWQGLVRRVERRREKDAVKAWLTRLRKQRPVWGIWKTHLGAAVLIGFVNIIPMMLVLLVIARASGLRNADDVLAIESILSAMVIVAVVSGLVIAQLWRQRSKRLWYGLIALTTALPLVFCMMLGAPDMMPMLVAHISKIGNVRAAEMTLSGRGCANLPNTLGISCPLNETQSVKLCDVHIMSRIGSETYLVARLPGKDPVHVLIPTDQILSVTFDRKKRPLDVATFLKEADMHTSACPRKVIPSR